MYGRLLLILLFLFISVNAYAVRISRPITFRHPIDKDEVDEINNIFEQIFLMQEGRYEADIVSTTKTNAKNGELWLIATGSTVKIQFKAGGHVYTLSPDGF